MGKGWYARMNIWQRIEGSWSSHDHVRHWMYEDIFNTLSSLEFNKDKYLLAEFGCREPTSSIMRMAVNILGNRVKLYNLDYPAVDLQETGFLDDIFDITVADQVFEHVEKPWVAAEELHRITAPGGIAIVCTPYIHPIHPNPIDCWRISPDGYKVLFPNDKWETIRFHGWGNKEIVQWEMNSAITRGLTGDWLSVKDAQESMPCYSSEYDGKFPIVLWWIGRKLV
jgi:SAM-dependent methyltransferase